MTTRALVARLEALEVGKQRRHGPVVAIYDPNISGDDRAAVERFIREHGRRPAALLPHNGRGDR